MIKINRDRLDKNIAELAAFGMNEKGGIDRSIGSEADLLARKWQKKKADELGCDFHIDAIANIWITAGPELFCEKKTILKTENFHKQEKLVSNNGMNETKLKPITIGSHHDAVPNGGKFDGAMGVLLGLEVLETLLEEKVCLRHPFQVVSFTAEEPNPFQISTMGSRSVTGKLSIDTLKNAVHHETKEPLSKAIERAGGDLDALENDQLSQNTMAAFMECHIEQGRNLYEKNISTAIVSVITGIYREKIKIIGEANHAGTTRMEHRHDALLAAAEAALAIEETVIKKNRPDVVGTVGWMEVSPNSANIIPAETEFIMELRMPSEEIKKELLSELNWKFADIEEKREAKFCRNVILDQKEAPMEKTIMKALKTGVEQNQSEVPILVSMAGHDAVHMSGITKTGMLFVKSIEGKSHCAEEFSNIEDIEIAGNVLVSAVLELDKYLD